ncbi:OmpA family protein [Azoarcus sp. TTM-91]|uniref:OmpA family protein n=1 Tax=Azoarcus sp. TTM-91 TaxID=2691581 RepID=UPI002006EBDE|nr:OmpA family protein [Azoarcus sp. TTM-91]
MIRSTLLPACLAMLLCACAATPPAGNPQAARGSGAAPGAGNAPRTATTTANGASTVNWNTLRTDLATALKGVPDVEISPAPEGLQLRLPVSNGFDSGKAVPRPPLTRMLDAVVAPLAAYPRVAIHVVGHTDSIGSEMYNLKLSISRAEAVTEYLRSQGLGLERLSSDGKGEAEPIADNAREPGRARNRRVEIYLRAMP